MGGINTLSGLNKVRVDYRPTITTNVQKPENTNQLLPDAEAVQGEAQQPQKAEAKSVVRELDVLLLNAAGKSVSADAAKNVSKIGKSLVTKGVLTQKEASKLESLAENATAKLKALDKFSGREIAKALMVDKNSGLVRKKGFFGLNATAKAVKAAVEAQEALSEELAKFNDRLAGSKDVTFVSTLFSKRCRGYELEKLGKDGIVMHSSSLVAETKRGDVSII